MSELPASAGYITKINPTEAELNLIARLRQIAGMCIVDSDSMTVWRCGAPEYCNGRKRAGVERYIDLPFVLPLDT